jgi:hypothetical protein
MRRRSPSLAWIKTVLADPVPGRDDPSELALVNDHDEQCARLIPESDTMVDMMADLDTDLAVGPIEK